MFSIMIKKPGVTLIFFHSGTLRKIYLLVFFVTVISISLYTQNNSQTCILLVCTRNISASKFN